MAENKLYWTSEMHEVAFLKCCGFDLVSTDASESTVRFAFAQTDELSAKLMEYINGKSMVEPLQYKNELALLKGMVAQARFNRH